MGNMKKTAAALLILAAIMSAIMSAGCGVRPEYRPTLMEQDDEWLNMVKDYRQSSAASPEDQELRASLKKAELDAAEHFYRQSLELQNSGKLDESIAAMQKGLAVMPGNEKLSKALGGSSRAGNPRTPSARP